MAATDVITLERAKRAVGLAIVDTSKDDLLQAYVGAVSQRLDDACGPVIRRTITGEAHDGGGCTITLRYRPVYSVTSVTEYLTGTATVLTAEGNTVEGTYQLEPWQGAEVVGLHSGRIHRRVAGWAGGYYPGGAGNVLVTYVAGRYATTADAQDSKFEQAARILLKFFWQAELMGTASVGEYDVPTTAFARVEPPIVRELLASEWLEGADGIA